MRRPRQPQDLWTPRLPRRRPRGLVRRRAQVQRPEPGSQQAPKVEGVRTDGVWAVAGVAQMRQEPGHRHDLAAAAVVARRPMPSRCSFTPARRPPSLVLTASGRSPHSVEVAGPRVEITEKSGGAHLGGRPLLVRCPHRRAAHSLRSWGERRPSLQGVATSANLGFSGRRRAAGRTRAVGRTGCSRPAGASHGSAPAPPWR